MLPEIAAREFIDPLVHLQLVALGKELGSHSTLPSKVMLDLTHA